MITFSIDFVSTAGCGETTFRARSVSVRRSGVAGTEACGCGGAAFAGIPSLAAPSFRPPLAPIGLRRPRAMRRQNDGLGLCAG
ncbi:MAG: hypothetical protein ACPGVZ_03705 [Myxococcota bacterium]